MCYLGNLSYPNELYLYCKICANCEAEMLVRLQPCRLPSLGTHFVAFSFFKISLMLSVLPFGLVHGVYVSVVWMVLF